MTLTRPQHKHALKHILEQMDNDNDNPLHKALAHEHIKGIYDIIPMQEDDIQALKYPVTDQSGQMTLEDLHRVYKNKIRIIKGYFEHRRNINDPVGDNWTDITADQLRTYSFYQYYSYYFTTPVTPSMQPNYPPNTNKELREILHHVLHTIFELDEEAPLVQESTLRKYNIMDFVTMSDDIIADLQDWDVKENLPSWQLEYINMFSNYFYYCQKYGESLYNNWTSLCKCDFEEYIRKYYPSFKKPLPDSIPSSSNCHIHTPNLTRSQNEHALKHILQEMQDDNDDPLQKALVHAHIKGIHELVSMQEVGIQASRHRS